MPKFKYIAVGRGRRAVPCADDDPEGREQWELSGKWQTKPGRKPGDPRKPVNMRLPPELLDWLRQQPDGVTGTIERLIVDEMSKAG